MSNTNPRERAERFAEDYGLQVPILLAPMGGACPPSLSIAVAGAGGMGGAGVLTMPPEAISDWVRNVRRGTNGAFQLNVRVPDRVPERDHGREDAMRAFLADWGPEVPASAANAPLTDYYGQLEAMIDAGPAVISSHMGLLPDDYVMRLKDAGIRWFASVTSVREAKAAEAAGADAIVAQGAEAGGHRASFEPDDSGAGMVGLFSLVPALADILTVPVIATGGIADHRGIAAALTLGASAVQIGTAFLRTPEAGIAPAWAAALGEVLPEDTILTRAFSGRTARSLPVAYACAAAGEGAPEPLPYPIQNNLTQPMRSAAAKTGKIDAMTAWAGQSAALGRTAPAAILVRDWWSGAMQLLG